MKNVIIDTDPGIDDAVAIMFALGSGQLDIKAITAVSGNLQADRTAANARKILSLVGAKGIPVARGPQTPLLRPYPRDPFSHGDDGLANLGLPESDLTEDPRPAHQVIIEVVNRHAGDITLIGLGPLTNIALAVQADPNLPRKVSELIIIGGSYGFHAAGSERATGDNPASEWNIYVDPEAAKIVFEAGFNLLAIGLDVATQPKINLSAADRERLNASQKMAAWFLSGVCRFVEDRGFGSYCGLIDALPVAAAIDRRLFSTEHLKVGIETKGELTLGETVVDRREHFRWDHLPTIEAASDVDRDRFEAASDVDRDRFFGLLLEAIT
jgi:purine nucleosidase/pyrimidine-specific ribonucleoside hydrolase